jgi:hypothetical protein
MISRPYAGGDSVSHWLRRTGIRAIDSLNDLFGIREVSLSAFPGGGATIGLLVDAPLNVAGLRWTYGPGRIPQVNFVMPGLTQPSGSTVFVKPSVIDVILAVGGGDCPSGCTTWHYAYVSYDPLRDIATLVREVDDPREPVAYWDTPTTHALKPYPSFASLLAGTRDERWWYRHHAVDALADILSSAPAP